VSSDIGPAPLVGVIMGSSSDLETMRPAAEVLAEFGVPHEVRVVSAHRSPLRMVDYATTARDRGLQVIIAGAGGAAHLPGMVASLTVLPVIGVPVPTRHLGGVDSLHSIVQMPSGVPVATMAIGGAANAGLLAVRMLALADDELSLRVAEHQRSLERHALDQDAALHGPGASDA
jgi:5-(carboxyamino)imidazole ribonucleotide mutase